jgi:hypothetical protein
MLLRKMLSYLVTPCPWYVRRMGYLSEILGIRTRYRRCREAWEPHLARSRAVVCKAAARCRVRRKALILGSGLLLDVPLDDLARDFREVILVDLIHPWHSRWRRRWHENVRLVAEDITGLAEQTYNVATQRGAVLPRAEPVLFLDDSEIDLVASMNLISQLPYIPAAYLNKCGVHAPDVVEAFAGDIVRAHLAYLRRFTGVVALIGDMERLTCHPDGKVVKRLDAMRGVPFPTPDEEWEWRLAPCPEAHAAYSYHRRVGAIVNLNGIRI